MKFKINFMSSQKILKLSKGEVKIPELLNHRFNSPRPETNGLLCERIFGPIHNYKCQCGFLSGFQDKNLICPKCGVKITSNRARSLWVGHIELPLPVINPLAYKATSDIIGLSEKQMRDYKNKDMVVIAVECNSGSFYLEDGSRVKCEFIHLEENTDEIQDFYFIPEFLSKVDYEKSREINPKIEFYMDLGNNPQDFILKRILVPPANFRPVIFNGNFWISHYLNDHYARIIRRRNRTEQLMDLDTDKNLFLYEQFLIQKAINELFCEGMTTEKKHLPSITDSLSGKSGLIRSSLLGKRVDYSARSVICSNPNLKIDELKVPINIALELFKPHITHLLLKRKICSSIKNCKILLETKNPIVLDILEEIVADQQILLNRAPSLHRYSIQAFKIKLTESKAIEMPSMNMSPFNADNDGDTVALHIPLSKSAIYDMQKLNPRNNLISMSDGSPLIAPSHEMIIGAYYATNMKKSSNPKHMNLEEMHYLLQIDELKINQEIIFKKVSTTPGRIILGEIMDSEITETLNKKNIKNFISDYFDCHSNDEVVEMFHKFQLLTFEYATKYALSISINDLKSPKTKEDQFYKTQTAISDLSGEYNEERIRMWSNTFNNLQKELVEELGEENPLIVMYKSGARASLNQISQLTVAKGLMASGTGKIIEMPVLHSLKEGLTPNEYFLSCYGSRKSLADKFFITPKSGYLARRLVSASRDLYVDLEDCKTTNGIAMARKYCEGRFTPNGELIGKNDSDEIIVIRSPITCEAKTRGGICQRCYGVDPGTRDIVKLNHPAGIIGSQSLCEPTTQLCLAKNTPILDINNKEIPAKKAYEKFMNNEDIYTFCCDPEGNIDVTKIIGASNSRKEKIKVKFTLDNDQFFECTLDHPWQLRDGFYKEAQYLQPGDSLMPLYLNTKEGYLQVRSNRKTSKGYKTEFVYRLAAKHKDVKIHESINTENYNDIHHINKIKGDNYPPNLLILAPTEHRKFHLNELKKRHETCIVNIATKLKNNNLELTNIEYEKTKQQYYHSAKYPCFEYAKENYPNLVKDFKILDIPQKSRQQLHVENRMGKVCVYMEKNNIESTYKGFDIANKTVYPADRGRQTLESLLFYSPNYLSNLNSSIKTEKVILTRKEKQAKSRLEKIKKYLVELDLICTKENLEIGNVKLYPKRKARRNIETLLKDYTQFEQQLDNHTIKSVEIINLNEDEEFYDFTVDSKWHNFALPGCFAHNSMRTFHEGGQAEIKSHPRAVKVSIDGKLHITRVNEFITQLKIQNYDEERIYLVHSDYSKVLVNDGDYVEIGTPIVIYQQDLANEDIAGKLPKIEHYFELKNDKFPKSIVAIQEGIVTLKTNNNKIQIAVDGKVQGSVSNTPVVVATGDKVKAGTFLTYGEVHMSDLWKKAGLELSGGVFVERLKFLYKEENIDVSIIHLEMIFRSMTEIVLKDNTTQLRRFAKDDYKIVLNSITKVARDYPSWLKVLGFGWLKSNLIFHALRGSVNYDLPSERIMLGRSVI